jgi:hypothetical protein
VGDHPLTIIQNSDQSDEASKQKIKNGSISAPGSNSAPKMEDGFFGDFQRLSHQLGELQPHHHGVNAGSSQKLLEALHQVLAECVAASIKDGADDATFPADLAQPAIPEGFKRCIGPCGRVLELNDSNFRRDGKKHKHAAGFRGRCKRCLSVKRENEVEAEQVPAANGEVQVQEVNTVPQLEAAAVVVDVGEALHDEGGAKRSKIGVAAEDWELDRDGFKVYAQFFTVEAKLFKRLCDHALKGEELFNNAPAGEKANDKLRTQVFFKSFISEDEDLMNLHNQINVRLAELFQKRRPMDMVLLRSVNGCSAQRAHTDYTMEEMSKVRDDFVPLGCVIALMDDTYFDVWPGAIRCYEAPPEGTTFEHVRLKLKAGDMLVFRGDLVHGGAAYSKENVRIHTYLDVRGVKRADNVTFFMDEAPYILHRRD